MIIKYLPKGLMPVQGTFGYYDGHETIYVANNLCPIDYLNRAAMDYLRDHEIRHYLDSNRDDITDTTTREQRANVASFRRNWLGGLVVLFYTVTSVSRWKYYLHRFKTGT